MNIALSIARWLLAIAISAALSLWIFVATINATVANREVVKGWLAGSGVYDRALGSLLRISTDSKQDGSLVTPDMLQEAFVQTFDGAYLKQSANTVIDATYDWLDGAANAITFSLPVQEKAGEFQQKLTALVLPKLQALPKCTTRVATGDPNKVTCLPSGVDPAVYAEQLTRPSNEANFLNAPLTHETFNQAPNLPQLPAAVSLMHTLMWALPVAIVIMGGAYVAASPDKLRGVSHFARRLTVGAAITFIGGLFLWYASTAIDLSSAVQDGDQQQAAIISTLINPLARTVLPDVGKALTLYSGIVIAIAGCVWLGVFIWRHKRGSKTTFPPRANKLDVPSPAATPQETQLPPPTTKPE